jgi:aspartyl-tRNA synthetase
VKCIAVPGGNDALSNVRIKPGGDVFSEAQKAGAGGLAFIRVREGGEIDTIGAIKDNLSEEKKAELLKRTGAEPGTLILFGAGDTAYRWVFGMLAAGLVLGSFAYVRARDSFTA